MCENENSLIGGDGKKRRRLTLFVFGAVLSFGSSRAVAPLCCVVLLVVLPALCCCLLRGLFPPFGWSLVLDDMLKEYDMKRDSVEINHNAPQWSHNGNVKPEIHGTEAKIHTAATVG